MLSGATSDEVAAAYRATVVAPRRRRIRSILDRAAAQGLIDASTGERDVLVTMCTGSWYAQALAGTAPRRTWSADVAAAVWRAARGAHVD